MSYKQQKYEIYLVVKTGGRNTQKFSIFEFTLPYSWLNVRKSNQYS